MDDAASSIWQALGEGVNGGGKKGWRGRGEWREEWGEQLVGRKDPAVFVLEVASGHVARLQGLPKVGHGRHCSPRHGMQSNSRNEGSKCVSMTWRASSSRPYPKDSVAASGPVWAPPSAPGAESTAVVCPVWSGDIDNFKSTSRRLGLVFCFNRPSAMYLVAAPVAPGAGAALGAGGQGEGNAEGNTEEAVRLTPGLRSALWPRFSPDGRTLAFVSHECAVESGAHMAAAALYALPWPGAAGAAAAFFGCTAQEEEGCTTALPAARVVVGPARHYPSSNAL